MPAKGRTGRDGLAGERFDVVPPADQVPGGPAGMVALPVGWCLVAGVVPQVGKATVQVLERMGVTVEMPWEQTCCGQMHVNTGYPREAIPLVRNHVAAFEGYDAIVVPSGSCTGAIRHQHADVARLAGDG